MGLWKVLYLNIGILYCCYLMDMIALLCMVREKTSYKSWHQKSVGCLGRMLLFYIKMYMEATCVIVYHL